MKKNHLATFMLLALLFQASASNLALGWSARDNPKMERGSAIVMAGRDSTVADDSFAELLIGLGDTPSRSYHELMDLIGRYNGKTVNEVSIQNRVEAITVGIPRSSLTSFVRDLRLAIAPIYIEPNVRLEVDRVPNDPYWGLQWGPAKIQAEHAWNITTGNSSIVVAIVDTGVDWNHPDLATNIWINTDEVLDGTDTDGNGYIDDIRGWDFVDTTEPFWPGEDGTIRDNDPMDFHGHGTHVSGIAAAVGNNGIGVAGVGWNIQIMAVRAGYKGSDGRGYLDADDAAAAIIYAADNGANIISLSWGSYLKSHLISSAISYAYDSGVLLVAAAGNDDTNQKMYPAAYNEVIAVTATDQSDDAAWFTNYGNWVELAAPGVSIYSTIWNDGYDYMSGTSMATPHVSGLAALIWSLSPEATRDEVRLHLRNTADDLGPAGFDSYYGYGRINAKRAIETLLIRDVAVTNVSPHKTIVGQGLDLKINVSITNLGYSTDTLNVTAYANETIIGTSNVTLAGQNSTIIEFTWNTTSHAKGNYTISAYIVPIPDEANTTNNSFADGQILVAMIGDLTGPSSGIPDGRVDIRDIAAVAYLFGIQYSEAGYDPNIDINSDGTIDIQDIVIAALNYGRVDP